jgi:hypothetical protein
MRAEDSAGGCKLEKAGRQAARRTGGRDRRDDLQLVKLFLTGSNKMMALELAKLDCRREEPSQTQ